MNYENTADNSLVEKCKTKTKITWKAFMMSCIVGGWRRQKGCMSLTGFFQRLTENGLAFCLFICHLYTSNSFRKVNSKHKVLPIYFVTRLQVYIQFKSVSMTKVFPKLKIAYISFEDYFFNMDHERQNVMFELPLGWIKQFLKHFHPYLVRQEWKKSGCWQRCWLVTLNANDSKLWVGHDVKTKSVFVIHV